MPLTWGGNTRTPFAMTTPGLWFCGGAAATIQRSPRSFPPGLNLWTGSLAFKTFQPWKGGTIWCHLTLWLCGWKRLFRFLQDLAFGTARCRVHSASLDLWFLWPWMLLVVLKGHALSSFSKQHWASSIRAKQTTFSVLQTTLLKLWQPVLAASCECNWGIFRLPGNLTSIPSTSWWAASTYCGHKDIHAASRQVRLHRKDTEGLQTRTKSKLQTNQQVT